MNAQFENVLNGGDGTLCEMQPGELADVNGGIVPLIVVAVLVVALICASAQPAR
jgi:lactobin A/cerein 7B family class IIb bacteriocin